MQFRQWHRLAIGCFFAIAAGTPVFADQPDAGQQLPVELDKISTLAERAMQEFDIPGMAIGIVYQGKTVFSSGFGIRELGQPGRVDSNTLFKIASNSKAFTTAALAILVDEGLIAWDGLVVDYIPEFRMSDPWVTAHFTVTDLLTHRSGLRSHVGDQLLWPEPNSFTRADIIHAFQYFEQVSDFRSKYTYDNLLYIVAGEVISRVSSQTWGEFVENRMMRPAGMKRCFADRIPAEEMYNLATAHGVIEEQLSIIERGRIPSQPPINAAAGGIVCSLGDMLTWVRTQLNRGTTPGGVELFSAPQSRELWKPHTRLVVSERDVERDRTNFRFYGLGWRLADVHGYKVVSHTGAVAGFRSKAVLVPEMELGVVLLTNGSSPVGRTAVMNSIVRSFMPVEQLDWIQLLKDDIEADKLKAEQRKKRQDVLTQELLKETQQACCIPDLSLFAGLYRDPWFGDVSIRLEDHQLVFASDKSPRFTGAMEYHDASRFTLRWTDRSVNGDVWVMFERAEKDSTMTMSILALTDDSDWDYKDLHFTRVQ